MGQDGIESGCRGDGGARSKGEEGGKAGKKGNHRGGKGVKERNEGL